MLEYRAYFVRDDGHFAKVVTLDCADDETAIAEAKQILDGHDIELWQQARMVTRLDHKKR